jgi:hypothetical protein
MVRIFVFLAYFDVKFKSRRAIQVRDKVIDSNFPQLQFCTGKTFSLPGELLFKKWGKKFSDRKPFNLIFSSSRLSSFYPRPRKSFRPRVTRGHFYKPFGAKCKCASSHSLAPAVNYCFWRSVSLTKLSPTVPFQTTIKYAELLFYTPNTV